MLTIKQLKNEVDNASYEFAIVYEQNHEKPSLFGIVRLSSKKASDISRATGIIADFVIDKFQEKDLSMLAKLGALQRDAMDLIMSVPIDEDDEVEFSLALVSIEKNVFYVYFEQPYFDLYLLRNNKVIYVNKDSSATMFTGSGKLQFGDQVFLVTNKFDIEQYLSDKEYKVHNSAAIIIDYKDDKPDFLTAESATVEQVDEKKAEPEIENEPEAEDEIDSEEQEVRPNPINTRLKSHRSSKKFSAIIKAQYQNLAPNIKKLWQSLLIIGKDTFNSGAEFVLVKILKLKKPSILKDDKSASSKRAKIGFIFIVLFSILLIFLLFKSIDDNAKEQAVKREYDSLVSDIQNQISQVQTKSTALNFPEITEINTVSQNIDKAATYTKYKNDSQLNSFRNSLNQSKDKINVIKAVADADILTVLTAKFPNSQPVSMALLKDGTVAVLDGKSQSIYKIDSQSGDMSEVKFDKFNTPQFIQALGDQVFVYDSSNGMYLVNLDAKTTKLIPGFGNLTGVKDFQTFDDKLYLLSDSSNKIWRSFKAGSSYSIPSTYNTKAPLPDKSTAFTIDGKIFVATSDGILQRFFNGDLDSKNGLNILGLTKNFSGNVKLVTVPARSEGNSNYLYIMDPDNSRILKINKDNMSLEAQYIYRGDKSLFKNLTSIALSEDEKTLYALDSGYIFKLHVSE